VPRQNVEELGPPPLPFRVDLRTANPDGVIRFETPSECVREDEWRAKMMEAGLRQKLGGRKVTRGARNLLAYLGAKLTGADDRPSAASRVAMRNWRVRVCSWLWSLIDPLEAKQWRFFTIVLPGWWVASGRLKKLTAKQLIGRLRRALCQAGSSDASGWLYAMIDGEFDGSTGGFALHVHGIATDGMIKVLRRLRKQPQFKRRMSDRTRYPMISVRRKLKIDKPKGYLPAAVTYTSKSFWVQHNSLVDDNGKRSRVGKKHRIAERKHLVRHLVWLHEQPVRDQVLLIHLSVIGGRLVPGKRGAR